jgi:predicted phosphodiesterase
MLALLYDVHGNLPALEAVLVDAEAAGATGYVLGGDYTMAGAWPVETVARLDELGAAAAWIRGNTDRWVAGDDRDRPADPSLDGAVAHAHAALGPEAAARLADCPTEHRLDGALCCHASPGSDMAGFAPEPDPEADAALLGRPEAPLVVVGHTHVQFHRPAGDGIHVLNPGSVGMPLDDDPRAAYALLDPDGRVELRRVTYPVEEAAGALRALGEPWTALFEERLRRASP